VFDPVEFNRAADVLGRAAELGLWPSHIEDTKMGQHSTQVSSTCSYDLL